MKLSQLLMGVAYKGGFIDKEISDVVCDSRKIVKDCIFVCIKGGNFDGHSFAQEAIAKGAACVVVEKDMGLVDQIIVENSRLCYGDMCAAMFANPATYMKLVGVTGTNGKTTVTTLIKHILTRLGKKVGLIGTIQNEIGDEIYPTEKTTPDAYDLQEMFAKMVQKGCEYAVMEVSSHALDQHRIGSARFASSAFTNLTQDHLDYHLTMDNYFDAKCKLFDMSQSSTVNIDDAYGKKLAQRIENAITFSIKDKSATLYAQNIENTPNGVNFELCYNGKVYKIEFSTAGIFSVYNVMTAIGVCTNLGFEIDDIVSAVNTCKTVKGRSEIIPTGKDFTIICDYAHTPDGIINILSSVNGYAKGRVVCLFGCGGNRDRKKRPLMAKAAAENSDFVIITSDNPRNEKPEDIITDVVVGMESSNTPYEVVVNRKDAIEYAMKNAQPDDVIVLAGKGHEDYQVIGDEKIHFDEREIVAQILKTME